MAIGQADLEPAQAAFGAFSLPFQKGEVWIAGKLLQSTAADLRRGNSVLTEEAMRCFGKPIARARRIMSRILRRVRVSCMAAERPAKLPPTTTASYFMANPFM